MAFYGLGSATTGLTGLPIVSTPLTVTTTITPDVASNIVAMNTAYSDAMNSAYNLAPYLYYSNLQNTPSLKKKFYSNLNDDKQIQKTVTKYFYYKIIDKWLYNDLLPLLAYLEIVNGEPQMIKSLDDYNVSKLANDSEDDIKKKVDYMEQKIISKDLVKHVLKKICSENNINWYSLNKHNIKVKKVMLKYIGSKIKNAIQRH